VKKISEKQNDTEKIFSKEIKITDEEMKRNYDKFLVMAFFGFVLVINNLIFLIISYITISISIVSYIMFFLLIPLGIAIGAYGLYGIYLHKRKPEKYSKEIKITDEEMRRNYDKFLAITFFGFVSVIINLTVFILQLIAIFLLIPLGIAIGAYGLYGLYLHKRKPEKYREILERKKIFSKEIKITDEEMKRNYDKFLVMAFFGFVLVIINLIFLMIYLLILLGIAIGAYGLCGIYLIKRKPEKYREILERKKSGKSWRRNIELVKKRSKILFIVGTIIIGLAILAIWVDLGLRFFGGWSGFYLIFTIPAYFFGLLLVVYSIHLVGNKWGWLDFPIAIVIFIVAIFQMGHSLELAYRLAWFLVFPLNYVALLILFLTSINKEKPRETPKITKKPIPFQIKEKIELPKPLVEIPQRKPIKNQLPPPIVEKLEKPKKIEPTKLSCKFCGIKLNRDARFCPQCGKIIK